MTGSGQVSRSSGRPLPARIEWALDLVAIAPSDLVLEFGCGSGTAAAEIARRLSGGRITAIDRSATAIARAQTRHPEDLASGRLVLEHIALAEFRSKTQFHKALGVNVNLFWTTSAEPECRTLQRVLVPGAPTYLVYDVPGESSHKLIDGVSTTLMRHGFAPEIRRGPHRSLVCIIARR